MTNLFEKYPQGVPVRQSSPVSKQSFSAFVPSPATTQELQRRPKTTRSVWERLTTPLVSEERVRESGMPEWLKTPAAFLAKYTTSPLDLALTPLIAFGGPWAAARVARGLAPTIGKRGARIAGGFFDPVGGSAMALPGRVLGETGINVGAGYGAEKGGILGGLAGGILGGGATLAGLKGLSAGATIGAAPIYKKMGLQPTDYYQRQFMSTIKDTPKEVKKEGERKLRDFVGGDNRQANKRRKDNGKLFNTKGYNLKGYTIEAAFKAMENAQKDFADSWLGQRQKQLLLKQGKMSNAVRKVFRLTGIPWTVKAIGKTYNPMYYADTPPKQAAAALEMHSYRTQTLLSKLNNYINSPLKSGKYWWNSETGFGKVDDNEYIPLSAKERMKDPLLTGEQKPNPNFGMIVEGPLATPAARRKMTMAGIEDPKLINTNRIYEEYFSGSKKLREGWNKVLTDDMKEYLERMKEIQDFREDLIDNVVGPSGRTLDIRKISEAEEHFMPTLGNKEDIDGAIDDLTKNMDDGKAVKDDLKYAGRIAAFNISEDNVVDFALKGRSGKWYKLGAKTGSERERQFISMKSALGAGWRYQPHNNAALISIAGVMRRGGELEMATNVIRMVNKMNKYSSSNLHYLGKVGMKKMAIFDKEGKRLVDKMRLRIKNYETQLKNDPELQRILDETQGKNGKHDKFKPLIATVNNLIEKLEKTAKQKPHRKWRSIEKEIGDLIKLKRYYPEVENLLKTAGPNGDALIVRAGTRLEDVIKEAKKLINKNIKVSKKQMEFVIRLQQARRIFDLKIPRKAYAPTGRYGEPAGTPSTKRQEEGVIDPKTRVDPETGQMDMGAIYGVTKADPSWYQISTLFRRPRGRGRPKADQPQEYVAVLKDLIDPDKEQVINNIMSKVVKYGWDAPQGKEIDEAIKILDEQMSILRFGETGKHQRLPITQEDWRRAAQTINKNGYQQVREQFDKMFGDHVFIKEFTDSDWEGLTKMLLGARNDLIDKKLAYEKRMFDIAKYHTVHHRTMRDINSPLFKNETFAVKDPQYEQELLDFKAEMEGIMERWKPNSILRGIEQINKIQRLNALAFDGSIFMIQLLPIMFNYPGIIPGAAKRFGVAVYKGLRDPESVKEWRANYLSQDENVKILKKSSMIMSTDPSTGQRTLESIEALDKSGVLEKTFGRLPGYSRLATAFGDGIAATMDFAGLELRKGLDPLAKNAKDAAGLDKFVDSIRGLASSQSSGVSFKQRTIESALLLAPRYRRAMFALYTMALKGGPEGYLARKAIVNLTAGVAMAAIGIQGMRSVIEGDSEEEASEKIIRMLDPTKGDFMLFDVQGQKVGPGSKIISDAKIITKALGYTTKKATGEDVKDWENFMKFDRDNPALKWVRAQSAAAPSEAIDIALGSNFIGEPAFLHGESIKDNILIAGRSVRENTLPLWIESALWSDSNDGLNWEEDVKGRVTRGTAEFFGLRSWPQGPGSILRQESFETMGEAYDKLEPHERALLSHELTDRLTPLQQQQAERGTSDFAVYFERKKQISEEFVNGLMELIQRYPNTKEGNRDLYFAYRQLKGFKRGREYQEMLDIEWEEHDLEHSDPIKRALAQAHALYDDPEIAIAPGVIDWDVWEIKNDALLRTFTPEQRIAVKRNQRKDPIPQPVLFRLRDVAKKEYKAIMENQALREKHLTDKGREDLAQASRDRFMMTEFLLNLDNAQQ